MKRFWAVLGLAVLYFCTTFFIGIMRFGMGMANFGRPITTPPSPQEVILKTASSILEFPLVSILPTIFGSAAFRFTLPALVLNSFLWAICTYILLRLVARKVPAS